jgi:hypothetical protein
VKESNPALAVDGGIPLQFHIDCPRPAATEERRWATNLLRNPSLTCPKRRKPNDREYSGPFAVRSNMLTFRVNRRSKQPIEQL